MAAWLRFWLASALAGLLAAALTLVLWQQWRHWQQPTAAPAPISKPVVQTARTPFSYADAVAAAAPSVVSIRTAITSKPQNGSNRVSVGLGSGVIWRQDGLIITNYHVIRQA